LAAIASTGSAFSSNVMLARRIYLFGLKDVGCHRYQTSSHRFCQLESKSEMASLCSFMIQHRILKVILYVASTDLLVDLNRILSVLKIVIASVLLLLHSMLVSYLFSVCASQARRLMKSDALEIH